MTAWQLCLPRCPPLTSQDDRVHDGPLKSSLCHPPGAEADYHSSRWRYLGQHVADIAAISSSAMRDRRPDWRTGDRMLTHGVLFQRFLPRSADDQPLLYHDVEACVGPARDNAQTLIFVVPAPSVVLKPSEGERVG